MAIPPPGHLSGTTLHGRYVLSGPVRSDPSGTVHPAHDLEKDRTVTVTVMHPWLVGDPAAVHVFVGRSQTLASVAHPGLARVLDHGRDGDHVFSVAEHAPGESLRDVLAFGGPEPRYSPRMALSIVADVLTALDAAHALGVAHGDLHADKVVLDGDGRVRVIGFPLPVSAEGDAVPESRTDVHAVGELLYTLTTNAVGAAADHPLRPSSVVPGLPADLDMLVANATDPNPRYRPRDAGQYLTLVEQVLRSLPEPPSGSRDEDTRALPAVTDTARSEEGGAPLWRRVPVLVAAGVLVLVLFAAGWAFVPDSDVELPDVVGVQPVAAEERLAALELDLVVLHDEAYSDAVDTGAVAGTVPEPGTVMEEAEEVTLSISLGSQFAEIPDVAGGSEVEARNALRGAGFTDIEIAQEHSADELPGTVLSTDPEAGEEGDREEPVTVHVSEGIVVPDLIGTPRSEADELVSGSGLSVEVVEAPHDTVPEGEVSGQDPEPGTILPQDGDVTLTVSSGPEEEEDKVEDGEDGEDGEDRNRDDRDDEGGASDAGDDDGGRGGEGDRDRDDAGCDSPDWSPATAYEEGDRVQYRGREYEARWWVEGSHSRPGSGNQWDPWADRGSC